MIWSGEVQDKRPDRRCKSLSLNKGDDSKQRKMQAITYMYEAYLFSTP